MASDSKWNKIQNFSNWRIYVYTHTYTYVSVYTQWRICAQRPENSSFFSVVNSSLCSELASRCIKKQKERCSLHLPGDLAVIQFQQQSCRLQSEFAGFSLPLPPPPPPLPLAASPPLLAEKKEGERERKDNKTWRREGRGEGRKGGGFARVHPGGYVFSRLCDVFSFSCWSKSEISRYEQMSKVSRLLSLS